jgi:hypothetical protein
MLTIDELLGKLKGVKRSGDGWVACCPVPEHDDHRQSLSVAVGDKAFLLTCHKGCTPERIASAVGLTMSDLFLDKGSNGNGQRKITATYDYVDETGELLFQKVRYVPKDFRLRRPDGAGGWTWRLGDVRRVLYRLTELVAGVAAGAAVYLVEGEKDVDGLAALGLVATCNPEGASEPGTRSKWHPEYSEFLRGAQVIIVADKDGAGRAHARAAADSLHGVAASVCVVEAAEGKDAADHLDAGYTVDEFVTVNGEAVATVRLPWITGAQLAEFVLPEPEYVNPPYFARGYVAQLVGKTKGGKTELARRLVAAVLLKKQFLGRPTTYTPVAYLTEESPASFGPPLEAAGIAGRDDLHMLFRNACDSGLAWCEMVAEIRAYVREHAIGLVVIDTGDPWMLRPGDDPNDAVTAEAAVRELQLLAEEGVAVIVLRHERKGGGDISDSGRGSSAFAGAVDVLLTLRHLQGSGHENRRELEAVARAALPDIPPKVVIELLDGEYVVVGSTSDVERRDTLDKLLEHLPTSRDTAATVPDLMDLTKSAKTLTQDLLRELWDEGRGAVCREKGAGSASVRAFGYWLRGDDD